MANVIIRYKCLRCGSINIPEQYRDKKEVAWAPLLHCCGNEYEDWKPYGPNASGVAYPYEIEGLDDK